MREIPVFYHIPRCAGTFLKFNVMIPSLRKNHQKENDELKQTNKEIPWCQLIRFDLNLDSSLVMPGKITFIVRTAMNKLFCPKFENTVTIDKFKEYLEKDLVMIVGATINPIRGSFNQSVELIEDFCKMSSCKPKYFTLMRDPFEWHNSFFHYLRDVGKWEPTYGFFENTTFKEYLTSEKISDGWLIRNLNEIPNEKPLTEKDYEKAIEILSNFEVGLYENLPAFLNKLQDIFGFKAHDDSERAKNENKLSRKAKRSEITKLEMETFTEKTKYDHKIYNYFKNKKLEEAK